MALLNTTERYGSLTKALHWIVAALFAFQLGSAWIMVRLQDGGSLAGIGQDAWYNWHKTIGLLALAVAALRYGARRMGELPAWAPTLTDAERRLIHRAEQALYLAMFVMPVSGFVFTMAGGYGVQLAGAFALPNPFGRIEWLGEAARLTHIGFAILLVAALAAHLGVVARHAVFLRDNLLRRMLPQR